MSYKNELYHYGIKGQKWGVRRYQNPDGSLTPAGRERYYDKNGQLTDRGAQHLRDSASIWFTDGYGDQRAHDAALARAIRETGMPTDSQAEYAQAYNQALRNAERFLNDAGLLEVHVNDLGTEVIGDGSHYLEAAVNAGLRNIYVPYAHGSVPSNSRNVEVFDRNGRMHNVLVDNRLPGTQEEQDFWRAFAAQYAQR